MGWLKNLMPWRCTPVLPTVYEDSLSYMEMICKLTKAMDNLSDHLSIFESTIIDQLGQLSDRIDQLDPAAESNAVLYTAQSLTESQKTQARANIGAISAAETPAGGDDNTYVLELGEIVPNGDSVTISAETRAALVAAFTAGKDIICRFSPTSWEGFTQYAGTMALPLTSAPANSQFNFSGVVAPYPFTQGSGLYDTTKTWFATVGVVGTTAGLTTIKSSAISTPATSQATSTSVASGGVIPLSGNWQLCIPVSSTVSSNLSLTFVDSNNDDITTISFSSAQGRHYFARAIKGYYSASYYADSDPKGTFAYNGLDVSLPDIAGFKVPSGAADFAYYIG